jgi:hypothetical protein
MFLAPKLKLYCWVKSSCIKSQKGSSLQKTTLNKYDMIKHTYKHFLKKKQRHSVKYFTTKLKYEFNENM